MSVPGTYFTGWRWLRGRAHRREYGLWLAAILPWSYVAAWAENPWTLQVLGLALLFQTVRRLHDIGLSGWWLAAAYVAEMTLAITAARTPGAPSLYMAATLLPCLALVTVALWPGERDANRFGPPPAGRGRAPAAPARAPDTA